MSENLHHLERKIGYFFANQQILKEAMTHGSVRASRGDQPHHERLEFLGDAILYTVTAEYLFNKNPKASEGELSILRREMITGAKQNRIAEELSIWKYVEVGLSVTSLKTVLVRGMPVKIPTEFKRWGEFIESLIGAVFVDAEKMKVGNGMQKAKEVIFELWGLSDPAKVWGIQQQESASPSANYSCVIM